MASKDRIQELEDKITRYYERYSAQRVALATLLVGVLSLLGSLGVYWWLESGLYAAIACLFAGFIGINVTFLTIVPPASSLIQCRELICGALREPVRIKSYDMRKVQLANSKGAVITLAAREQKLWAKLVVPYLIQCQAQGHHPSESKPQRKLTASERKYIEQRRKEVLEMEKKIEEDRQRLEKDRKELEVRGEDLKKAEEMVITRLTGVEEAEAELEQLKIVAAEKADQSAPAYDQAAAEAKDAELRVKEAELAALKAQLAEDRESWETQKSEWTRLKASVTRAPFLSDGADSGTEGQSLADREAALEARQKQLEDAARDLEERASFVTDSENSLIERLDALSHREASVEQSEINAGLRKDT